MKLHKLSLYGCCILGAFLSPHFVKVCSSLAVEEAPTSLLHDIQEPATLLSHEQEKSSASSLLDLPKLIHQPTTNTLDKSEGTTSTTVIDQPNLFSQNEEMSFPVNKPDFLVRNLQSSTPPWVQIGNDIDGEAGGDQSGYRVALSKNGKRVAIGSFGHDSLSGQVRVHDYNPENGNWDPVGTIDGENTGDRSATVDMSEDGSRLVIGSQGVNTFTGRVRIYDYDESTNAWAQVGGDIHGKATSEYFGYSVAMSKDGSRVVVGADGANSSGQARVYEYKENNNTWDQVGGDIDGEAADDNFGWSVAMSKNGSRVAIGAYTNDGANGDNSGHVRVYDYDESKNTWDQVGGDIDGEAAGDRAGSSVALSDDGAMVAVGAKYNDENGDNAGHVRVYSFPGSANIAPADSGEIFGILVSSVV